MSLMKMRDFPTSRIDLLCLPDHRCRSWGLRTTEIAFLCVIISLFFMGSAKADTPGPIIIDHTCTDLSRIPPDWIEQAKQLTIHYAHTSHGSQIVSGLLNLETLNSIYSFVVTVRNDEGLPSAEVPPALRMYDGNPDETYIEPDDYWDGQSGENRTRAVADTGHYDFSMWSWCGQVSEDNGPQYIQSYLDTLDGFEANYPAMRFIYMTGHLDGTGSTGTLHIHNEQIRSYCRANNKVLFDFADIERYDPDGEDFLDRGATDGCDYDDYQHNWAEEWCAANPGSPLCTCLEDESSNCYECAHSNWLNCNQKARAFWWMMARLAGWPGPSANAAFDAAPRAGSLPLMVTFTDQSSGEATSWSWNFGDGGVSSARNPVHTYTAEGSYTVSLTACSGGECSTETRGNLISVAACANLPARIGNTDYPAFLDAYESASPGDHILIQAMPVAGPVILNDPLQFLLSAGFGCDYAGSPMGVTTVSGHLAVEQGDMQIIGGCLAIGP
ncbi:MAG: hypothetical protein AUK25_01920 [Desulfobacteraceae bacterium CG2_30_51_40]|nr:MAG: hypothetical protein AUK25_01920 [Desulfobacteraceae bacterium CG2_30_51_40]